MGLIDRASKHIRIDVDSTSVWAARNSIDEPSLERPVETEGGAFSLLTAVRSPSLSMKVTIWN